MIRTNSVGMAAVVATFFLWSLPVGAQTALQDSIASRTSPHTNPIGMVVGPYGSFLLSPEFTLDTEFTDNVFSVESGKLADVFFTLKPKINLRSDWVNHSLNFSFGAIQTKYIDNVGENFFNYDFGVTGRLNVLDKSDLTASLAFQKSTQGRGDVDDDVAGVFETEQTTSTKSTIKIGGLYNEDVYLVKLDFNLDLIDFEDAGTTDNDDRDRIGFKSTARVGYEWVPGSTAFIEARLDIRHFDKAVDDSGFKRSSRGYEFLIGNTLDLSAVTFAELGIGFIKQDFGAQTASKLGPTKGVSFKGSLIWNPTDMITITGNLRRKVSETTLPGASSAFTSSFELKADYGILEELLLSAGANLDIQSFDGIGRLDKLLKINLGAKYFIGPYFIAGAKYTYEERFSDDPGGSFVNNGLIISLTSRF